MNLWESHESLSAAHSVKAYLLSSLRRLLFKRIRRNKNRAERNRNYVQGQAEVTFSIEKGLIRKEIAREKREQLQKALQTLTSRQKEAVFLKFYHGLTNKELVEVMDISYQGVRNVLSKAIKRLRASIASASYQD